MAIIGICGLIGSGKGVVSDILREEGYHSFNFADALKDAVSAIFVWPRPLLEGDTEVSRKFREKVDPWWSEKFGYDVTPRLILQRMGTEACRNNISQNIWICALEKRIYGYRNVVVSDVRFPNEMEFVRRLGGKIWNVRRGLDPAWWEDAISWNEGLVNRAKNSINVHPSEYSLAGETFDAQIQNDGTIEELKAEVNKLLTSLEKDVSIFHHQV